MKLGIADFYEGNKVFKSAQKLVDSLSKAGSAGEIGSSSVSEGKLVGQTSRS